MGGNQDSMEGKARVGAGCKREGQEETEIAVRPSQQRGPGYNTKRPQMSRSASRAFQYYKSQSRIRTQILKNCKFMQVFLCFGLEFPISPELKRTQGSCTSNKNIINPAGFARFFGFEFSASAELKTIQNSENAIFIKFLLCFPNSDELKGGAPATKNK